MQGLAEAHFDLGDYTGMTRVSVRKACGGRWVRRLPAADPFLTLLYGL